MAGLSQRLKIVIPGGSGQVGHILARHFHAQGHAVTVLSRDPQPAPWRIVPWDGATAGDWTGELEGSDICINVAGRSVNCRYHAANRRAILQSRLRSTHLLNQVIAALRNPPPLWINASTATIYRHALDRPMDEFTGEVGGNEPGAPDTWNFSIVVAKAWEETFFATATPRTRKVAIRSAMTFSPDRGGVFDHFLSLVRYGVGGPQGSGTQFVSWIHETDFVRAIEFVINHHEFTGIVNLASPNPLPNREFMQALRDAWGIRIGLPTAGWLLEIGAWLMRTESELVLKSRRVTPGRLLACGFQFQFPEWRTAACDLVARWRNELAPKSYQLPKTTSCLRTVELSLKSGSEALMRYWPVLITLAAFSGLSWAASSNCDYQDAASPAPSTIYLLCEHGGILASTDGGGTWMRRATGMDEPLLAMAFLDTKRGFIVGSNGLLLATTDGGMHWQRQKTEASHALRSISVIGDSVWVSGDEGVILHSGDGGQTWKRQISGVTRGLEDIYFADAQHGWAVGWIGAVLRTTDGGEKWEQVNQKAASWSLSAVYFRNVNEGWAVGFGGQVIATRDGGVKWEKQNTPAESWLSSVRFDKSGRGWITTGEGFLTSTDGKTWRVAPSTEGGYPHRIVPMNGGLWAIGSVGVLRRADADQKWTVIKGLQASGLAGE